MPEIFIFEKKTRRIKNYLSEYKPADSKINTEYLNELPKISIITPSFNQGPFLERTILSVLNQNYPNLEYIIMDGGSSDNSIDIIKKYEQYLYYWKSESDKGQSDAISRGFKLATGDILAWINSDDVYWPDALFLVGQFFLKHPGVSVVYGNSFSINENDKILRETRSVKFSKWGFLTRSFSLHQASIFWKKKLYDQVEGINSNLYLAMDRDLWFQFYLAGAHFMHLGKTISCYRVHSKTKTSQFNKKSKEICDKILQKKFNIHTTGWFYRIIRKTMRLRTLGFHIFKGNLLYLIKNAGRKF